MNAPINGLDAAELTAIVRVLVAALEEERARSDRSEPMPLDDIRTALAAAVAELGQARARALAHGCTTAAGRCARAELGLERLLHFFRPPNTETP